MEILSELKELKQKIAMDSIHAEWIDTINEAIKTIDGLRCTVPEEAYCEGLDEIKDTSINIGTVNIFIGDKDYVE